MADDNAKTPPADVVIEMPWVLISNQIQQLSTQMNGLFHDQRLRFDDSMPLTSASISWNPGLPNASTVSQRRLTFHNNSTWWTMILALLTLILGPLLPPKLYRSRCWPTPCSTAPFPPSVIRGSPCHAPALVKRGVAAASDRTWRGMLSVGRSWTWKSKLPSVADPIAASRPASASGFGWWASATPRLRRITAS